MEFIMNRVRRYGAGLALEDRQRLIRRVVSFQNSFWGRIADVPCALLFGRNLTMLATIYLSDKWNNHWYAQHYEAYFRPMRRRKINILEIGIGGYDDPHNGGNSLRMWRSYFPRGTAYGLDIYDKSSHNRRRIKTFQGSQTDPECLDFIVSRTGPLSIIIDDGSHRNGHVLFTFHHLFSHLVDGGIYAIEDTQTSYWPQYGGNTTHRNDPQTTMGYFKSLADGLNWVEVPGDHNPSYLDLNIKSISFFHNLIIVVKGSNRERGGSPHVSEST